MKGPTSAPWKACDDTKPSISPPSHDSCCTFQAWLVDGSACAVVVVVSAWNGSRYPSGFSVSGWYQTLCPEESVIAFGSEKPRAFGSVPK